MRSSLCAGWPEYELPILFGGNQRVGHSLQVLQTRLVVLPPVHVSHHHLGRVCLTASADRDESPSSIYGRGGLGKDRHPGVAGVEVELGDVSPNRGHCRYCTRGRACLSASTSWRFAAEGCVSGIFLTVAVGRLHCGQTTLCPNLAIPLRGRFAGRGNVVRKS